MNRVSTSVTPPFSLTTPKYAQTLAYSWPWSAFSHLHIPGLHTHLELPWSWYPGFPCLHHYPTHVFVLTCFFIALKCISKYTWAPPSSTTPNLLDYYLQVHFQTQSITASNCISKLTWSQPQSSSPNFLNDHLQASSLCLLDCQLHLHLHGSSLLSWKAAPYALEYYL